MPKPSTTRARTFRNNSTDAERQLWQHLRASQLNNCKFRRQYPVGPYVADFACLSHHLIVEVDGGQHAENADHDIHRDRFLRSQGFNVLRFWNNQVMSETEAVLAEIRRVLIANSPP